ncbi:MAG: sulfurtransferase TusA family protein [Planctomycetota bacterium]
MRPEAVEGAAEPRPARPEPDAVLDVTGVPCPRSSSHALTRLEVMDEGELLELSIADGEARENVPATLAQEGHVVLSTLRKGDRRVLLVRRGSDV